MTAISITQDRLKELLYYNKQSGIFVWKSRPNSRGWNSRHAGKIAGSLKSSGYMRLKIYRKDCYIHRLAILYVTGAMPPEEVDHINGNTSDNSYNNLRCVTRTINSRNTKLKAISKTGISGVNSTNSGKWESRIFVDNKNKSLGTHDSFFEACCIRKSAELRHGYHPNHGRRA